MKNVIFNFVAMIICGVAFAQDPTTVSATQVEPVAAPFKMQLETNVGIYDFGSGTISQFDADFSFKLTDKLTVGTGVSIINNDNPVTDPRELAWQLNSGVGSASGTGIGDVDFFVAYDLFDGKCDFLHTDKAWIDVTAGIGVPVDGTYSSDSMVYHVGGDVGLEWGKISIAQSVDYCFVNAYTFVSPLGGFVNDDVYTGITTLSWKANDSLGVALKVKQYLSGDSNLILVGPALEYKLSNSATFKADVGVPVTSDISTEDLDIAFSAGVGFKF